MSLLDIMLIGSAAFIGWWLVSWLFDARKPKAPEESPPPQASKESAPPGMTRVETPGPTLMELGERWHAILGVPADASAAEIEAGYRAALAACDRDLLTNAAGAARRQQIEAAYQFIRSARKDAH